MEENKSSRRDEKTIVSKQSPRSKTEPGTKALLETDHSPINTLVSLMTRKNIRGTRMSDINRPIFTTQSDCPSSNGGNRFRMPAGHIVEDKGNEKQSTQYTTSLERVCARGLLKISIKTSFRPILKRRKVVMLRLVSESLTRSKRQRRREEHQRKRQRGWQRQCKQPGLMRELTPWGLKRPRE